MNRVIIGVVAVLTSITFLHGGRTDSNGGHYDSSAGEYHYHHGYSAHDHYDMDGDGIVDCPYTFKDNTTNNGSKPEIHIDPKDYDSFEEWSNAKHGISKEQEEEDEKKRQAYMSRYEDDGSSDTVKKENISVTLETVLVFVIVAFILLDILLVKDFINNKHRK